MKPLFRKRLSVFKSALAARYSFGQANQNEHHTKAQQEAREVFPERPWAAFQKSGRIHTGKEARVGINYQKSIGKSYRNRRNYVKQEWDKSGYPVFHYCKCGKRWYQSACGIGYRPDACKIIPAERNCFWPCGRAEIIYIRSHSRKRNTVFDKSFGKHFGCLFIDKGHNEMSRKELEAENHGIKYKD